MGCFARRGAGFTVFQVMGLQTPAVNISNNALRFPQIVGAELPPPNAIATSAHQRNIGITCRQKRQRPVLFSGGIDDVKTLGLG
jgi:hypothetical protein